MNETLTKVMNCDDINAIKNVIAIMFECTEANMNGKARLQMMKQIQSEISGSHYDESLSDFHLALIGNQHIKDAAIYYWKLNKEKDITIHDWLVLWAEMARRHGDKIRKWFPQMANEDLNDKLFDECLAFLKSGGEPFRDLNP